MQACLKDRASEPDAIARPVACSIHNEAAQYDQLGHFLHEDLVTKILTAMLPLPLIQVEHLKTGFILMGPIRH